MGDPVKFVDFARRMIALSGLHVQSGSEDEGVESKITDLQPSEKFYEELLIGEPPMPTGHQRLLPACQLLPRQNDFIDFLQQLDRNTLNRNDKALRKKIGGFNMVVSVIMPPPT